MAFIVVLPEPTPWTSPLESIVATDVADEVQLTAFVLARLRTLPSLKVPMALNVICVFWAITGLLAASAMETRFDKSTVTDAALLLIPPNAAVIVAGPPTLFPNARPLLEVTNTSAGFEDTQLQTLVISCFVPSLKLPVAVNCS